MTDLIVDVKIWGMHVGSLVWDQNTGIAFFEFNDRFRQSGLDLAPLTMPLSMNRRTYSFPANKTASAVSKRDAQ